MAAKVKFHPEAEKELRLSFLYYFDRSQIVAASFQSEAEHAIDAVSSNPDRWPILINDLRRYIFPRFPFFLIYRSTKDGVEIIAVAHQRRRPGYWSQR